MRPTRGEASRGRPREDMIMDDVVGKCRWILGEMSEYRGSDASSQRLRAKLIYSNFALILIPKLQKKNGGPELEPELWLLYDDGRGEGFENLTSRPRLPFFRMPKRDK